MVRESCCCSDGSAPSHSSLAPSSSENSVTAAGRWRNASLCASALDGALPKRGVARGPRPRAERPADERATVASLPTCSGACCAVRTKSPTLFPLPSSPTKSSPPPAPPTSRAHIGFIEVKWTAGDCVRGENAAAPLLRTSPFFACALRRCRLTASTPAQAKTSAALAITPPSGAGPSCSPPPPAPMLAGFAAAGCGEGSRGAPREVRPMFCDRAESGTPLAAESWVRKGHSEVVAKPQQDDPAALLQSPTAVACVIAAAAACERAAIS